MTTVQVAAMTARGRVRAGNEDAVAVFGWLSQVAHPQVVELRAGLTTPLVCAVADGMGGHAAGEVASAFALTETITRATAWTDVEAIRAGLTAVNEAVLDLASRSPGTAGMGTTVAGLAVTTGGIFCFNVGDSRVYQVTDGFVELLSVDDAVIAPDGSATSSLTQAIGDPSGPRFRPHVCEVIAEGPSSRFLLCSDGVTGVLEADAFRKLCRQPELRDIVTGLRDAVYDSGAEDNLSIIALDVIDWPPPGQSTSAW
ncbi:PP2C family serine/threonine-protein phosphatase [Amycolatopsis sp. Hca4]|uniref:PP2C family protein-serine/threonine phosphatase n=1 Tax=Amycolatopsis sp. Hca4 TaxID=2742131 RepID=UPI0015925604|nr:PP2C family serine/threonine-protein phosphatase [Amycolatopsis sp. Hca4]QKV74893.1 serine/threonine-protein phosphatase [Amycolatopsis sp. Hca4]